MVLTASAEAVVYYLNAGSILCAGPIASSVGCGGFMPHGFQVHQSIEFSLWSAVVGIALV